MGLKTIGIITFHTASNYGAVLQAYALQSICQELGYNVVFIRYSGFDKSTCASPVRNFLNAPNVKRGLYRLLRSSMSLIGDKQRNDSFKQFRQKYFKESVLCHSTKEIASLGVDAYIAGSDQIWNYRITGGNFDSVYFLNFDSVAKKIIYAASAQDVPFSKEKEIEFKNQLESCRAIIGIRESSLAQYISHLCEKDFPVVLDPTLLAGREILDSIVDKEESKEPFILLYQIDTNPCSNISVYSLEKCFRCKVYTMTVPRLGSIHGRRGNKGPEVFLWLLKNAQFLVTNSFHGVALSILYHKQFFVYENNGVMNRIDDLLGLVGITHQKVCVVNDIDLNNKIDYSAVDKILKKQRMRSMVFLKSALTDISDETRIF